MTPNAGHDREPVKVTASRRTDESSWAAAHRRHMELRRQFDAAHEYAKTCLAIKDYDGLAKAIDRERLIIDEQTEMVDRYLASTKPPDEWKSLLFWAVLVIVGVLVYFASSRFG